MSTTNVSHPLISIGASIRGRDGDLGEVSRVIVDPSEDRIIGVVAKRGRMLATERVVELERFRAGEGDDLVLDLDQDEFEQLPAFDEQMYTAPDPDYSGPPGFDYQSRGQANMSLATYVAMGPLLAFGTAAPVGGYAGGEPLRPVHEIPTVSEGDEVLDRSGNKVGEVAEMVVDPENGKAVRLVVKKGFLFKSEFEVPVDWIGDFYEGGVGLNVSSEQIEALEGD